jgi:hypothetical protein
MRQLARWFAPILVGVLVLPLAGCKEKEPDPERPKMTRPKLPVPDQPTK